MKLLPVFLGISLLLNAVFAFHSFQRNIVVSVPDGDSLQMKDGRRVRLLGINAPERDACMGTEARETLKSAVEGKHVRMKNVVTDDYGRQLANVIIEDFPTWVSYLQGKTDPYLNRVMVKQGLAKFGGTKSEYYDSLKNAQNIAKENKLGIWSETCRKIENPDCDIKGNIRAGKKTYLLPTCKNYNQTIIDTSFGDRWFCSETEATKAGFTKSTGCH